MADGKMTVWDAVRTGLWTEVPILRLILGMCPTLAVTTAVKPAMTMGLSVLFVLVCSNIVVSLLRKLIQPHLRILIFTLTIATFVTIADLFLRAFVPNMSEVLGPYVPLIIVNCIIIARAEACASKNNIVVSAVDGACMGFGFTVVLCILAGIRELLAAGTVCDVRIMPGGFVPWAAMRMPVGAFITLGLMIGFVNVWTVKKT